MPIKANFCLNTGPKYLPESKNRFFQSCFSFKIEFGKTFILGSYRFFDHIGLFGAKKGQKSGFSKNDRRKYFAVVLENRKSQSRAAGVWGAPRSVAGAGAGHFFVNLALLPFFGSPLHEKIIGI